MVANECVGNKVLQEVVMSLQPPVELEEVLIQDAGPDRLPQFVLRYRINRRLFNKLDIVAVDDFTQEPGIRV